MKATLRPSRMCKGGHGSWRHASRRVILKRGLMRCCQRRRLVCACSKPVRSGDARTASALSFLFGFDYVNEIFPCPRRNGVWLLFYRVWRVRPHIRAIALVQAGRQRGASGLFEPALGRAGVAASDQSARSGLRAEVRGCLRLAVRLASFSALFSHCQRQLLSSSTLLISPVDIGRTRVSMTLRQSGGILRRADTSCHNPSR